MYEMTVGEYLEKVRKRRKLSAKKVCEGICDPSMFRRYENDEISPGIYTLKCLLERMGVDPLNINYICSEDEYMFEILRTDIVKKLEMQDLDSVRRIVEDYKNRLPKRAKVIHIQFILYIEAEILLQQEKRKESFFHLKQAFEATKGDLFFPSGQELYSLIEFKILMQICKICGECNNLEKLLRYVITMEDDNIIKLRYYGEVVRNFCLLLKEKDEHKVLFLIEEALEYHKKMYIFRGVKELLEIKNNIHNIRDKVEKKMMHVCTFLYENVKENYESGLPQYRKSLLLKQRRIEVGLTRESLSEGVCDVTTLLRYENGVLDPSDEKYMELMSRMDNDIEMYQLSYETGKIIDVEEYRKWEEFFQKHKEEEVIDEILSCSGYDVIKGSEAQQYYDRFMLYKKYYCNKEIDAFCYIKKLEEIVSRTIREYKEGNYSINKLLTETEIYILNDIAIAYIDIKKYDFAEKIYMKLREYFKSEQAGVMELARYKIMINYSNLLGQMGKYKESYEVCNDLLYSALINTKQKLLFNPLFNMGWNIMESIKKKTPIGTIGQAREFINSSCLLCRYYNESEVAQKVMSDYFKSNFSDNMVLYKE